MPTTEKTASSSQSQEAQHGTQHHMEKHNNQSGGRGKCERELFLWFSQAGAGLGVARVYSFSGFWGAGAVPYYVAPGPGGMGEGEDGP